MFSLYSLYVYIIYPVLNGMVFTKGLENKIPILLDTHSLTIYYTICNDIA